MRIFNPNTTHLFLLELGQTDEDIKEILKIIENPSNIDYENIYDEGQDQGRQSWLRLDQHVDSLQLGTSKARLFCWPQIPTVEMVRDIFKRLKTVYYMITIKFTRADLTKLRKWNFDLQNLVVTLN